MTHEDTRTPMTRGSALRTAMTTRGPRWSRFTANAGAAVAIAGLLWVAFNVSDRPAWYLPIWYTAVGFMFVSFMFSLSDERWTDAAVNVARSISVVLMVAALATLLTVVELPLWVALAVFGGVAVSLAALSAGAIANYRGDHDAAAVDHQEDVPRS